MIEQVPKEGVLPSKKEGGGDFQCHLPIALFRRLKALNRAKHGSEAAPRSADSAEQREQARDTALILEKYSEYGVLHTQRFENETQFADAMVEVRHPLCATGFPVHDGNLSA